MGLRDIIIALDREFEGGRSIASDGSIVSTMASRRAGESIMEVVAALQETGWCCGEDGHVYPAQPVGGREP